MTTLLLTGVPRIRKTTALRRVVDVLASRAVYGDLTEEVRQHGQRTGFRMASLDERSAMLARIGAASPDHVRHDGVDLDALERLAIPTLALESTRRGVPADEFGRMECFSPRFTGGDAHAARCGGCSSRPLRRRPRQQVREHEAVALRHHGAWRHARAAATTATHPARKP